MASAEEEEALRPTYFELAAAEGLVPSLKAALVYSLSVLAQRRPGLHRLLDAEDEAFAALMLLVEYHSLTACDASVAESFYGLRRASASPRAPLGNGLTILQRWLSLFALVGLPYLRAKAERAYAARAGGDAARLGLLDGPQEDTHDSGAEQPQTQPAWSRAERVFMTVYPWAHAVIEGGSFLHGMAFVLLGARTHNAAMTALRLRLLRARPDDLAACAARTASARAAALASAQARHLGALRVLALRTWFGTVDAARPSLVAAVLGFKALEWWFGTAEAALAPAQRLPVPPPPPPLPVALGGVPLPEDARACPVCLRPRTNPAVAAPSGIAFCYPCLRAALDATGRCPVTGVPVAADQVRRLYEAAS